MRDDKSYPYVGDLSSTRSIHSSTSRARHCAGRAYFGPSSEAHRAREIVDLWAAASPVPHVRGHPAQSRPAARASTSTSSAAAPCVGYVYPGRVPPNIDRIVDFLGGRYATCRPKWRDDGRAAERHEFERAALHRDRLAAISSLFERQRVAGGTVGTADSIGVAAEGEDANAQVFQVRDGILAERQSFYLDNQAERDLAEVAEEFVGQNTRPRRRCRAR